MTIRIRNKMMYIAIIFIFLCSPLSAKTVVVDPVELEVGENKIKVVVTEEGKIAKEYTLTVIRKGETPKDVSFIPEGGVILSPSPVVMNSSDGASIYYTTDNSDPKTSPTRIEYNPNSPYIYNGPDEITLKAIAEKENSNDSEVSSVTYKMAVSRLSSIPFDNDQLDYSFDPETFTYPKKIVENNIYMIKASISVDATISVNDTIVTSSSIELAPGNNTIKVEVAEEGKIPSEYTFNIMRKDETPQEVTFTPKERVILSSTPIVLNSTDGATIYYTTDGSDPKTSSTRIEYTSPFFYTGSDEITFKAIAEKENSNDSIVSSGTYTIAVSRLSSLPFDTTQFDYSFDPETFIYPEKIVENNIDMIKATIDPETTISVNDTIITSSSIDLVPGNNTIKVYKAEPGKIPIEYIFSIERKAATPLPPTVNPSSGAVAFNTPIIINSSEGATIYYTTDSSDPKTSPTRIEYDPNSPYIFNGPDEVTLKAFSVLANSNDSEISTVTYKQAMSRLSSIPFDQDAIEYEFDPETFTYSGLVVEHSVSTLSVTEFPHNLEVSSQVVEKLPPALPTAEIAVSEDTELATEVNPTEVETDNSDVVATELVIDPIQPIEDIVIPEDTVSYISIEPSRKSYTSLRYKVGDEEKWTAAQHTKESVTVVIEDRSSILYVQESKDGVKWTDITPYSYEQKSSSWKPGKKIPYTNIVESQVISEDTSTKDNTLESGETSYSIIRYQVGKEIGDDWIIFTPKPIVAEDASNTYLYVQASSDGKEWTDITPFVYGLTSPSSKTQNVTFTESRTTSAVRDDFRSANVKDKKWVHLSSLDINASYQIPLTHYAKYQKMGVGAGLQLNMGIGNIEILSLIGAFDYTFGFSNNPFIYAFHDITALFGVGFLIPISDRVDFIPELTYGPVIHILDTNDGDPLSLYMDQMVNLSLPLVYKISKKVGVHIAPFGGLLIEKNGVGFLAGLRAGIKIF